jgi:4-amino-4-deoxy-L-arabinose transferase-like glycosyltransferase
VFTYFALRRFWPERQTARSFGWGTLLALAVAALWYAPVMARHGWQFIDQFFIQHHFARYLSNKYHHPQPFYFYLPVTLILTLPWSVFLVWSLVNTARSNWRAPTVANKFRVFALAWLIVPLAFFSLSNSKLPGYILPALPGAALLAGERLVRFARRGEAFGFLAMRLSGALTLLLAAASVIFAQHAQYLSLLSALIIAAPLIIAGGFALLWTRQREWCVALLVCAMFSTLALAINRANEEIAHRESVRELLQLAALEGFASTPVVQLHTIERSAEFYAAGRLAYQEGGEPVEFDGVAPVLEAARSKGGTVLVIVPVEYIGQLTGYALLEAKIIGDNKNVALVAAHAR